MKRIKTEWMLAAGWLLVVLSFVCKHVNNDFFVFWGYGKQVRMAAERGTDALLAVWDVKGMLFRFYVYVEYLITSAFCGDVFTLQAMAVYKLAGVLVLLAVLWVAVRVIPGQYVPEKMSRRSCFMAAGTMLLACHCISHLQSEMLGVFILMLATALGLSDDVRRKVAAGVLTGLLFFLKSPLIVLAGTLFFICMLLKRQSFWATFRALVPLIVSAVLTLGGGLLFLYVFCPQELIDIYDASQYEHTLMESPGLFAIYFSFRRFLSYLVVYSLMIPVLGLAILCFVAEVVWGIWHRHYRTTVLYVLMLFFPVVGVMVSNCFFPYHYYMLSYPAVVIVFYSGRRFLANRVLSRLAGVVVAAYFVAFVWLFSAISPYNIKVSSEYQEVLLSSTHDMQQLVGRHPSSKILYLDSGLAACVFPTPSYLRYIYPLPIQRFDEGFSGYVQTDRFKAVKQQILDYDGDIIVCHRDWFFCNAHPDIQEKIEREYEQTEPFYLRVFQTGVFEASTLVETQVYIRRSVAQPHQ